MISIGAQVLAATATNTSLEKIHLQSNKVIEGAKALAASMEAGTF